MRKILRNLKNSKEDLIHIVFVCTANCSRSPLAEILFEKMLMEKLGSSKEIGNKKLYIDSAAITFSDMKISENSMKVLVMEEGLEPKRCLAHRGKLLDQVNDPDLILVMAENHLQHIHATQLNLIPISYRLDDFVKADSNKSGIDIPDPHGGCYEDFQNMKNLVKQDLKLLMEEMSDVGIL